MTSVYTYKYQTKKENTMSMTKEQVDEIIAAYRAGKTVILNHDDDNYKREWSLTDGAGWLCPPIAKGETWTIKPDPKPEGRWVVRDVNPNATNEYEFTTTRGYLRLISSASSVPGFGGIQYEGHEGKWLLAPPSRWLESGEAILAKPLRVRFWVEGGAE